MTSVVKNILYASLDTMDVVELYGYINEIELGYIKVNYHPEDNNLVILNYTDLTTYEKRWNEYTMSARGLILDLTSAKDNGKIYILAKPFEKFPNYGSNEIEGYEDDIDFTEVESIMEKMDGSLGISYFFNDEIRFATRGSFSSEQAIKATEIWKNKYAKYLDNNFISSAYVIFPYTLLVEIIYPQNRVVVDYDGLEDLVLLGANDIGNHHNNIEWSYEMCKHYAKDIGMLVARQYDFTIEQMLEMKKTLTANEEGFIVRFRNGKRLKIKGDEYLQVHRIKHGMSTKAKYIAWSEDKLNEYIMMLPEEFRQELEDFGADLNMLYYLIANSIDLLFNTLYIEDKKEYALRVQKVVPKEYRKFMFAMHKTSQVPKIMIKEYIAKDYKEFEEVIALWSKDDS